MDKNITRIWISNVFVAMEPPKLKELVVDYTFKPDIIAIYCLSPDLGRITCDDQYLW